ncbi:MAG: 4Fe-4S binding protein [Spirochaetes bacterium]|nr:4Fe-4S binding protein [Spirochaetota bacterium]
MDDPLNTLISIEGTAKRAPPIFTQKTECQDCYKCIRECPVKAIQVKEGDASILPELCILCGHCVDACPRGAKQVRDDIPRAAALLQGPHETWVSLAPSFLTEFPGVRPGQLIAALRLLGFARVSETAIGAELVSHHVAERLARGGDALLISSACPTAVEYLRKYAAPHAVFLTELLSPLLAHARLLRQNATGPIALVFIGPCIAKKIEADQHPELVDVALTFEDLHRWLAHRGIRPASLEEGPDDAFSPRRSRDGALYPVEGGMIRSIQGQRAGLEAQFLSVSGIARFAEALAGLDATTEGRLFLELLACPGGCVNGPKSHARVSTVCKHLALARYARAALPVTERAPIEETYSPSALSRRLVTEEKLREVLRLVGKEGPEDELNCGGCGYESCRDFALAYLDGKAERTMCVAHLRALAQKKADVLLRKLPSALALLDRDLRVVECNPHFNQLFAGPKEADGANLEGRNLGDLTPFTELFENFLRSGEETLEKDLRFQGRILHTLLFQIEKHDLFGALFEDITRPATQREQIIRRSRQVIQQNLKTVQEIASLIGENAADSEIILSSIVDSFQDGERAGGDHG